MQLVGAGVQFQLNFVIFCGLLRLDGDIVRYHTRLVMRGDTKRKFFVSVARWRHDVALCDVGTRVIAPIFRWRRVMNDG